MDGKCKSDIDPLSDGHRNLYTMLGKTLRQEKEVNTNEDWESQMVAMEEQSNSLTKQHSSLRTQQEEEEKAQLRCRQDLEKKKEQAVNQHKALLDKIESMNVKLQLNNSKAARKSFAAKKQEMNVEKRKAEEEENRLSKELEESEKKLTLLMQEKNEEKETWERELGELRGEMGRRKEAAQEAQQRALKDEITAVEAQRDACMTRIESWLAEVEQYLNALRMDHSQQHMHQRMEWERQEAMVRSHKVELDTRYKEALQQLRQGCELESLPPINENPLPPSPMVELIISQMSCRPPYQNVPMGPPPHAKVSLPYPQQDHLRPQQDHLRFRPPARVTPPPLSSSPIPTAPLPHPAAHMPSMMPPPQALPPANPQPAGKLDKVLDKLLAKFPQSSRDQLMLVLQQIKAARGTMAGMSMDEVTEQVALKLAQNERPAPGPISRPTPAARGYTVPQAPIHYPPLPTYSQGRYSPAPSQRSSPSPQRQMPDRIFQTRPPQPVAAASNHKMCLMCQNHVDADNQYPLSCSHTIHKDCISVWLQSSKNNTCPFCSSSN